MPSSKIFGQVPTRDSGPLVIATDGSSAVRPKRKVWQTGWGFLGADGRYGCGWCPQPVELAGRDPATVAELRAVWYAIGELLPSRSATVWTDSLNAVTLLQAWQAGDVGRMPRGYLGSQRHTPRMQLLARTVARHGANLTVEHVKGHAGQLLNEAADSLAKIGRSWTPDTTGQCEARARRLVEGFIADPRLREVA